MKSRTLQAIKVGYGDEKIAFYPKMVFQSERDEVERTLAEITSDTVDRYQKIFEVKRDAVAEFSAAMPQRLEKVKNDLKLVPLVSDAPNISDAMQKYFSERTPETEEIISKTYSAYISLMSCDVLFL